MKKVLAFGASNSKKSINKALAFYVASQLENTEVILADLNDYVLPIYSPDREQERGIPENARKFDALLDSADAHVISLAEYNGNATAVFKNLFDWLSRIDQKVFKDKPMFLLATSPGRRGGKNVMEIHKKLMPFFGGKLIANFSLPHFYQNFSAAGIGNAEMRQALEEQIQLFQTALNA
ncbi:MAG: NAD(P)H-dependent oxidoreductase [Bacteroidota bacterium]